jgi:hypothetical protein
VIALLLTIIVEFFPLYFFLKDTQKLSKIVFVVLAVNLITNPIANHLYPSVDFWSLEFGVLVVEAVLFSLLFDIELKKGVVASLFANIPTIIISLVIGMI